MVLKIYREFFHEKDDVMNINCIGYFEHGLESLRTWTISRWMSSIKVILTLSLSFIYLLSSLLLSIILSIINSSIVSSCILLLLR